MDAGHGGRDPGATHFGLREKNFTLDIARRLSTELRARGFAVQLTRDTDEFIPLSRRPAIASDWDADLFVSIHINANKRRSVSGAEVYYPRESVLSASAPLPSRLGPMDIAGDTPTVRRTLWDLILSQSRRQSVALASQICRAFRTALGTPCRGVHGARFVVLKEARMPAVLVEVGFISNHAESEKLRTGAYRQQVAQTIADALEAYARLARPPT